MIIAITGGTGFIGKKLALRHLVRGDEVRILSRRTSSVPGLSDSMALCFGDLNNVESLKPFVDGADVLYHCAGEIRDITRMEAVHVQGTRNLIDAASGRIGRWVQLSSVGAYGQRRKGAITEETPLNPCGIYEETKVQSDALVDAAAAHGAFPHVILRPSNVYGAEMTNQSLFGLISMIQRGLLFFIGKPGASANYIHVDNVVEALVMCGTMPSASGRVYNLSDYRNMEQFIATIAAALGKDAPRMRLPEAAVRMLAKLLGNIPGMPLTAARVDALTSRTIYPTEKIERELGYRHLVTMEEGLSELVAAWKQKKA